MDPDLKKPQWNVVEFTESKEISVIPQKWIILKEGTDCCYWPKAQKARKYIKKIIEPNDSWSIHQILVLLPDPVSYEEALHFEKQKENVTESEEEFGRFGRKRKQKKDDDFVTDTSICNDESYLPSMPLFEIINVSNTSSPDTLSFTSTDLMPPPPPPSDLESLAAPSLTKTINNLIVIQAGDETNQISESQHDGNIKTIIENQNNEIEGILSEKEEVTVLPANATMSSKIDTILRTTSSNKILLERILLKLNMDPNAAAVEVIHSFDTVPKAPFKKFKKLLEYESQLQSSIDAQKQLETAFYMCGGSSVNDCLRRGLKRLFTDKLATRCSWLGRKNNHKICDLITTNLLRNAVRKMFPNLTDAIFEGSAANWFRQSKLRYQRHLLNQK